MTTNYLVYSPCVYNRPDDNWLLDVELYSEEFRADLISIWMDEMGLISNPAMRKQVKNYRAYGDALDHYFRLGRNLNQRDTIAVRRMIDGYLKLMYPNGEFTKEELEEIIQIALEMRRRVKEQLKKLGGMEFYDVNFSYI